MPAPAHVNQLLRFAAPLAVAVRLPRTGAAACHACRLVRAFRRRIVQRRLFGHPLHEGPHLRPFQRIGQRHRVIREARRPGRTCTSLPASISARACSCGTSAKPCPASAARISRKSSSKDEPAARASTATSCAASHSASPRGRHHAAGEGPDTRRATASPCAVPAAPDSPPAPAPAPSAIPRAGRDSARARAAAPRPRGRDADPPPTTRPRPAARYVDVARETRQPGTSHDAAKDAIVLTVTVCRDGARASMSTAASICENACRSSGCAAAPSAVSRKPWRSRVNSATPSRSSSKRTCWLTAPASHARPRRPP